MTEEHIIVKDSDSDYNSKDDKNMTNFKDSSISSTILKVCKKPHEISINSCSDSNSSSLVVTSNHVMDKIQES